MLEIAGLVYAALSVVETIAGIGAATVILGEAKGWWDLL